MDDVIDDKGDNPDAALRRKVSAEEIMKKLTEESKGTHGTESQGGKNSKQHLEKMSKIRKPQPYWIHSPTPGGHVFQKTGTIFKLIQDIMKTNVLNKKNALNPSGHDIQPTGTIFELIQSIIVTNHKTTYMASSVLTKKNALHHCGHFHEDWTINVTYIINEKCPAPGGNVFQPNKSIFELFQEIIGTNLLTMFHEKRTINVSRVLTKTRVLTRKNAPPPGGNVFQPTGTIFKLIQDIIGTNLLTKFHYDLTINVASRVLTRKTAPPPQGHFHDDWTINVASRVITRKNAPPPGGHVFSTNWKRFSNTSNVDAAQRTTDKKLSQKLTLCSGELKT
ncbi:hypothetical protein DPMN_083537 [Dreissena polymorpha]|uniref:Uncharacterized protein n=1 Tax=Dreissena polymorpha TaxID=45954 RepID=A0A9D3YCM4_DREPO|nr:hypothetical protein DPMN_083537 [Dreissena polymorpha]